MVGSHDFPDWHATNRPGGHSYGDVLGSQARNKNPGDELIFVFTPMETNDPIIVNMHQPRPNGNGVNRDTMTIDEWHERNPGTARRWCCWSRWPGATSPS